MIGWYRSHDVNCEYCTVKLVGTGHMMLILCCDWLVQVICCEYSLFADAHGFTKSARAWPIGRQESLSRVESIGEYLIT